MPYIPNKNRSELSNRGPNTAGERNYVRFKKLRRALRDNRKYDTVDGLAKELIITLLGEASPLEEKAAALLAFLEFYRRDVAKLEDTKIIENGDVD